MKIIFFRYDNICEPYYLAAFKYLGIEVVVVTDKMEEKEFDLKREMLSVGQKVIENRPIFVFSINFFPYVSIVCEKLKVLYVAMSVDCPVMTIYHETIRNACNRIFLFDYKQYLSIKDENPGNVFYLPLGADMEVLEQATQNISDYSYEVSFVGSLYKEKDNYIKLELGEEQERELDSLVASQYRENGLEYLETHVSKENVQAIKNASISFRSAKGSICDTDLYEAINDFFAYHLSYMDRIRILNRIGEKYDMHLWTLSDISELHGVKNHGRASSYTEMPAVFRKSKININHTMRAIQTGLPQRIWDVLGCRGFLLTNYQEELPEYFVIGKHLEAYENDDEMMEKIDYYLKHEDEREEIAISGYQLVKEKHTVLHRVMDIIKTVYRTIDIH